MKKAYSKPSAETILFGNEDILTKSPGGEHGMDVPAAPDEDWDLDYVIVH
jgi:hypothetical protein